MTSPFADTSSQVAETTDDRQERNRLWWEIKPMTYADWSADDRLPENEEDFRAIETYVLEESPFLRDWFARLDLGGRQTLDLGCGSGIFSTLLAQRGGDVSAIDLTEAGVNLATRTASVFGVGVQCVRGDAEAQPFADDTFDFVYSWGVLHHTQNMARAVREMSRILRPGGRGMMMVYHRNSVVYYLHGLFWLLLRGKLFQGHTLRSVQDFYTDGYYHRYLTPKELERLLDAARLTTERFSVTQYKKKILPFIPSGLDRYLKARFGMCLVAEFAKRGNGHS